MAANKKSLYLLKAQQMYIEGHSLESIGESIHTSRQTLGKWKSEYNWDDKRSNYQASASGAAYHLRLIINQKIAALKPENVTGKDTNEIAQLVASLRKLERDIDIIGAVVLVMNLFGDFLKDKHSTKQEELAPLVAEFYEYAERYAEREARNR